jgi:nicotinic acid mononucleotide adenylyltransferase
MAILDRTGYTDRARNSVTARTYQHLTIANSQDLAGADKGLCFLNNPPLDLSSSKLLERMRAGERHFKGPFQEIADYIVKHGLYNIGPAPAQVSAPTLIR